jgi:hypothetical protein
LQINQFFHDPLFFMAGGQTYPLFIHEIVTLKTVLHRQGYGCFFIEMELAGINVTQKAVAYRLAARKKS